MCAHNHQKAISYPNKLLMSCVLTFYISATASTANSLCATATGKDEVYHHSKNEGHVLTSLKYLKITMD